MFYHYTTEISRAFKKQYLIVFGILYYLTGQEKSTLIAKIIENSKLTFRSNKERFKVFHHRPHILPNIAHIFKKEIDKKEEFDLNFNPHSEKQSKSNN